MDTNYVISAPVEEQDLPLELTREHLLTTARAYQGVLEKARQLLDQADESLLSGSAGTVYLKKMGHRLLTTQDSENIIRRLGTDEDRLTITLFAQAQQALSHRLSKTKGIGMIMEQAGVPYLKQRRRTSTPELWKAEEIIQVVEVLQRLQL